MFLVFCHYMCGDLSFFHYLSTMYYYSILSYVLFSTLNLVGEQALKWKWRNTPMCLTTDFLLEGGRFLDEYQKNPYHHYHRSFLHRTSGLLQDFVYMTIDTVYFTCYMTSFRFHIFLLSLIPCNYQTLDPNFDKHRYNAHKRLPQSITDMFETRILTFYDGRG